MALSRRRAKQQLFRHFSRRSSGVERALGKGEVECSIHSGGTSQLHTSNTFKIRTFLKIRGLKAEGNICRSMRFNVHERIANTASMYGKYTAKMIRDSWNVPA